jgi:hypothetical protein
MKIIPLFLMAVLLPSSVIAQKQSKADVLLVKLRDTGPIFQNEAVVGYYNFYNLEKEDRKNNNFQITVTDENLREINSVNITRPNTYLLIDAVFNGSSFGFLFYDMRGKSLELLSYDKALKPGGKVVKPLKNKYGNMTFAAIAQGHEPMQAFLISVPNKGFMLYGIKDESKSDFQIECYDNAMKRVWFSTGPNDDYEFENALEAFQSDQFVGSLVIKRTGLFDMNPDMDLLVQNIIDGKILFRVPLSTAKYKMALADIIFDETKQQFVMFGEFYGKNENVFKEESQGLSTVAFDMKGTIVSEKISTWENDIHPKVEAKDKQKFERANIFFHDFVRTTDGQLFAVGEQYRKGGTPMAPKINVLNMVIFQFDAGFSISKVHVFEKDKNSVALPQGILIGPSKMMSYYAKSIGGFDYTFTQKSKSSDVFVVSYINYNRERGEKGKNQLGSIVYTPEKKFTVDKLDLNRGSSNFFVYGAKQGYVMISEYFKKNKRLDRRLEKINY